MSEGCRNCYMMREKKRYGQDGMKVVRSSPQTFNQPLSAKWKEPAKVFVCSWSDFFIEEADAWRADAWDIMRKAKHLTFQICTKRSERIAQCLPADWGPDGWPNVWLGVTIENDHARHRLFNLNQVPARVWFASFEPLIGDVGNLGLGDESFCGNMALDWAIIGAESGPGAREMQHIWAHNIIKQCKAASTAVFVKQIHVLGGKLSKDPAEWPEHLRLREFPR